MAGGRDSFRVATTARGHRPWPPAGALGRPQRAGFWPGDTTYRKPRSATWGLRGPDDDPSFAGSTSPSRPRSVEDERQRSLEAREAELRKAELDRWEDDLARRERELRDRGTPPTSDDSPA